MEHDHFQGDGDAAPANAPDFIAWHVSGGDRRRRRKPCWTRIGAAWLHGDGMGLNLQLDLIPVGKGRIVLRAPKVNEPAPADETQPLI